MSTATAIPTEAGPLKLHDEYLVQKIAGFDKDLTLHAHEVQDITTRVRGICSIMAVLQVGDVIDVCTLGEFMRHGLLEAAGALSVDVMGQLEKANERAQAMAPARTPKRA